MNELDFGLTVKELESLEENAQASRTSCEGGSEGDAG